MDEVDIMQGNEERLLKITINNRRHFGGTNGTGECIDCGKIIPAARRKAAPGCERCVGCQEIYEGNSRGTRRKRLRCTSEV